MTSARAAALTRQSVPPSIFKLTNPTAIAACAGLRRFYAVSSAFGDDAGCGIVYAVRAVRPQTLTMWPRPSLTGSRA